MSARPQKTQNQGCGKRASALLQPRKRKTSPSGFLSDARIEYPERPGPKSKARQKVNLPEKTQIQDLIADQVDGESHSREKDYR